MVTEISKRRVKDLGWRVDVMTVFCKLLFCGMLLSCHFIELYSNETWLLSLMPHCPQISLLNTSFCY